MRKYITKPNSRTDKFILSLLVMLTDMHFYFWIDYQFRNLDGFLWLTILTKIGFGVVTVLLTYLWYWNLHSKEKKLLRLKKKVFKYLYTPNRNAYNESSIIKLIDDICNATIVPIDERKKLFDAVCNIWTEEGKEIPPFITEKWKKAVIEYKKYEIWID